MEIIGSLRDLNMASTIFRITLAIIIGGVIGMERGRKHRPRRARRDHRYISNCLKGGLLP